MSLTKSERMEAFTQRGADCDCWEWAGTIDKDGYGRVGGREEFAKLRAHRVAYEIARGDIPSGLYVCHSCDNRRCVNPAHLWLGTCKENLADMVAKGRGGKNGRPGSHSVGSENPNAKLSADVVREIRASRPQHSLREMAKRYGITKSSVCDIVSRRSWAHVS